MIKFHGYYLLLLLVSMATTVCNTKIPHIREVIALSMFRDTMSLVCSHTQRL